MASANLELVRSIYAAWGRGDYNSADWAHPEIELVIDDGPSPGTWTGPTGMAEAMRDALSGAKEHRTEAEEYRELDGGRILVRVHRSGRGKASGVELGQIRATGANVFSIRDGKVTRLVIYFDWTRALADLWLAQEAGGRPS